MDENGRTRKRVELPVIAKVYDFNPDDPGHEHYLIDIQTYKRIIGELKESGNHPLIMTSGNHPMNTTSGNFNEYDTDYGKPTTSTATHISL